MFKFNVLFTPSYKSTLIIFLSKLLAFTIIHLMIKVFCIVINIDINVCDFTVLSILTDSIIYPNLSFNFISMICLCPSISIINYVKSTEIYYIEITKQNCITSICIVCNLSRHLRHILIRDCIIQIVAFCW